MSDRYFPAIVEQGSGGFYVSFPDVPGCVSHGTTLEELAANAEAALALHLAESAEDGRDLPVPSALGDTPVDPAGAADHMRCAMGATYDRRFALPPPCVEPEVGSVAQRIGSALAAAETRHRARSGLIHSQSATLISIES